MKTFLKTILPNLLLVAALVGGAYFVGQHLGQKVALTAPSHQASSQLTSDAAAPTATVRTVLVRQGSITQTLDAFGVVVPQLGQTSFVSVPLESRINRILVHAGQRVAADEPLFELELSPTQQIAIAEAKVNADTATTELAQVQQRKSERLATNQELSQAQQTASVAQAKYRQFKQESEAALANNTAGFEGVVNKIDAQPGQIVLAGAAVVEVVSQQGIEIQLGVEAADIRLLKAGQAIDISSVMDSSVRDLNGIIRLVSESIDPQTRLANVFVTLPSNSSLLLGQIVRGTAAVNTIEGMIVPRQSVLPNGKTSTIYSVMDGKAVEHQVEVGIDSGSEIEIRSSELKAGMPVITIGSSQVSNGMSVVIASPSSESTSTGDVTP